MSLSPGARVGHYEIVGPIGAGGMGEVYRARDPRIRRDVALKILPTSLASDPDRLRRFEQEARAVGALNHPNLLVIFDVGTHDGTPFLVAELLEGETLRERTSAGPLPLRKALDYAVQIAHGLAAAHAKGIIHRDLKPENIFITSDDRVKLLDFGLAKVVDAAHSVTAVPTARIDTDSGVVVGTAGYMSPEQVRGDAVDERSDVFSFGVVLHEMITGAQPFRRGSVVETMNAIIHDDAPPITDAAIPPAIPRLLEHALDKNPSRRFESMKDVAFAIAALSATGEAAVLKSRKPKSGEQRGEITYERVTFRRGTIMTARFAPDRSVVYGAAWDDKPVEVFSSYASGPEARAHGLRGADVLAVAPGGELALALDCRYAGGWVRTGTLARRPLAGGAPRPVADSVECADWVDGGRNLLVVRSSAGVHRIECPVGRAIHESSRWISSARVSPRGDRIAFIEHPHTGDNLGSIVVIDPEGHELCRSTELDGTSGLAWTPKGDQVWVSAAQQHVWSLVSMTMKGRQRTVLPAPTWVTLHDIDADGRVLVSFETARRDIAIRHTGAPHEQKLGWFDWSWLADLSDDGRFVLFAEQGAATRYHSVVYLRTTDGGEPERIGAARVSGNPLTPDAQHVVLENAETKKLELVPVGIGQPQPIPQPRIDNVHGWQASGDMRRLLLLGSNHGEPVRLYEMALDGDGTLRQIGESPAAPPFHISRDGRTAVAAGSDSHPQLYDVATGQTSRVPGCEAGDVPIGWTAESEAIYVHNRGRMNVVIERVDVQSGQRTKIDTIVPGDPAGIIDIGPVRITPDGRTFAYGFRRFLSDLYVITGLV